MNSRTLASTEVLIDTLTGLSTTWASLAENPQNLGGLLMGGRSKPVAPCYRVFAAMRTAELAAADTVTRRAIVAQHVEGHTANQGQVLRAVILTRSTAIFTKLDVQHQCC